MANITIDFTKECGRIKPLHGVGQPPMVGMNDELFHYLTEASIPFARLHDMGFVFGGKLVDIPLLFRDFDADPSDPANYDFAFTDVLIKDLMDHGVEPFFRLGVSIENYIHIKAYHIYPPKDSFKWAQICEGIIRHYTEGWADGFHYNIRYWEIWNEPDNYDVMELNQMWRGTMEQFFELYGTASKYLKEKFPHLKIGGYASCGFYAIAKAKTDFGACTPRRQYFVTFFDRFLAHIKANNCPLDFFSWHSYASLEETLIFESYAREKLDEAGYTDTETTMNEWNCEPNQRGTIRHAALTAGMMLAMQDRSLDSAMFYDARCGTSTYSGMFNPLTKKPFPAYYAFMAFAELYRRGTQTAVSDLPDGVYACAAKDKDGCLVIANTTGADLPLSLTGIGLTNIVGTKVIDADRVWEDCDAPDVLSAESVLCIFFAE